MFLLTFESLWGAGASPRNKALAAALFLTGCRVSEGAQLKTSNVELTNEKRIRCIEVLVVRQKEGRQFRTFSFPRREPAWPCVRQYLTKLKPQALLFPSGGRPTEL